MSRVAKLLSYRSLPPAYRLLLLEAFCYLLYARLLMLVPFRLVAPRLGKAWQETSKEPSPHSQPEGIAREISSAIHLMSRYTPWASKCMVRAMASLKMLDRRGIESTLYLGTARGRQGELEAHAWLRCGAYVVTGAEEMGRFTVVSTFASRKGESDDKRS
jgi:hypothetical protein